MPDTFGFDVTDFQPILNRIMEEYNKLKPDAVAPLRQPHRCAALYKGLRTLGVTCPSRAAPPQLTRRSSAMGPDAVEGFLVLDSGGIVNPAALPDTGRSRPCRWTSVQRYQAKYNEAPDFFSAVGADMVAILAEAMKQAGGADDKQKVADALINLKDFTHLKASSTSHLTTRRRASKATWWSSR